MSSLQKVEPELYDNVDAFFKQSSSSLWGNCESLETNKKIIDYMNSLFFPYLGEILLEKPPYRSPVYETSELLISIAKQKMLMRFGSNKPAKSFDPLPIKTIKHRKTARENVVCSICLKKVDTKLELQTHWRNNHQDIPMPSNLQITAKNEKIATTFNLIPIHHPDSDETPKAKKKRLENVVNTL